MVRSDCGGGFIYILNSPNSDYIKIGGSAYPPAKRIKEINSSEPYKSMGQWTLYDFRQVTDWRKVEYDLHYVFRDKQVTHIANQKELFELAPHAASERLSLIVPEMLVGKPKVDRMFTFSNFAEYIIKLFRLTGLLHWLDSQGAWTFTLFPTTNGGRYFTLNINSHEVAFATLAKGDSKSMFMLYADLLLLDFSHTSKWLKRNGGRFSKSHYASALPHGTSVYFTGDFETALEFLSLPGVRRALLAYWIESLLIMSDNNKMSLYSKVHNYNAVAEIKKRIEFAGQA